MVKSVCRYLYFLRSYKHLHVPCLPLNKVLNVGPLLCQASVQSIHPIVHNPDKNRKGLMPHPVYVTLLLVNLRKYGTKENVNLNIAEVIVTG